MDKVLNIGSMLKAYIKKNKIVQKAWADKANVSAQRVNAYMNMADMRVSMVISISETLEHNFLRELADMLPPDMKPQAVPDRSAEVAELQQQISNLKLQLETFKEALRLAGSGGR